jgi:hypothetical protein
VWHGVSFGNGITLARAGMTRSEISSLSNSASAVVVSIAADDRGPRLASARARGRTGGRPFTMTPAKVRLAMASMGKHDTNVSELCKELGVSR